MIKNLSLLNKWDGGSMYGEPVVFSILLNIYETGKTHCS